MLFANDAGTFLRGNDVGGDWTVKPISRHVWRDTTIGGGAQGGMR
ncbi:MAG: hypothetical protein U0350_11515 [Caldilineaceae bacterium]